MPIFQLVPWLPRVVFKLSLENLWLPLRGSSLPTWPSREPSDLSGLKPDGSPWAILVLCLWLLPLTRSSLRSDCSENHLIYVVSIPDTPPWLAVKSPLSVFLGQLPYIIFLCVIVYFAFRIISVFFPCSVKSCSSTAFSVYFQFNSIVPSLLDCYPTFVLLLFSVLILEMYSRCIDPLEK